MNKLEIFPWQLSSLLGSLSEGGQDVSWQTWIELAAVGRSLNTFALTSATLACMRSVYPQSLQFLGCPTAHNIQEIWQRSPWSFEGDGWYPAHLWCTADQAGTRSDDAHSPTIDYAIDPATYPCQTPLPVPYASGSERESKKGSLAQKTDAADTKFPKYHLDSLYK